MKKLTYAMAILAVATVGAQAGGPKKKEAPKTIKCPVMTKNSVNIAEATKKGMYADYKGRRYYFCCNGCPAAFKKDPAKYAKQPSLPTPKKEKAK